jgi:hypothetical protein
MPGFDPAAEPMLELNLVYTRIKDMQGRLADLGRYL